MGKNKAEETYCCRNSKSISENFISKPHFSLEMYVKMLLEYQKHLSKVEKEINALAKEIDEYKIIQSIPGIGEKIAATIISEIGEIDRFNHPKNL